MQTLERIIEALKKKPEIDATMIGGSQSRGEEKEYSDIDIAVILKENKENIFSLFQYIDNKPADVFFYNTITLQKLLSDEVIPANTMDGVLVHWLKKGKIMFDKSGTLTFLKEKSTQLEHKLEVPKTEMSRWEALINSGYVTNKRYFESGDKEYLEILKIKLLQDIYNVFLAYFEFRNIPWRGEKQMLRYAKENDTMFYNLFMSCVSVESVQEKFKIYSNLVTYIFTEEYGFWDKTIVNPFIKGVLEEEKRDRLVAYWNDLIK